MLSNSWSQHQVWLVIADQSGVPAASNRDTAENLQAFLRVFFALCLAPLRDRQQRYVNFWKLESFRAIWFDSEQVLIIHVASLRMHTYTSQP